MGDTKSDVYTRITDRIVADLEKGVRPWHRPWSVANTDDRITRPLRHNGIPYKGINVIMLWSASVASGYASPLWLTFRQALELGGNVRKGGHGELVVYANRITRTETNDAGEETEREIPFLKGYTVFNADQCEGLPAHYYAKPETPALPASQRIAAADTFFAATRATIRHGGTQAYYAIGPDHIQMPPFETFTDAGSHAATLAHELVHWTRHASRLNRDMGRVKWGDEGYAREELVAELGSAFLSADLGIAPDVRPDHAAYIANWLKVLKDDKRFIFSAAAMRSAPPTICTGCKWQAEKPTLNLEVGFVVARLPHCWQKVLDCRLAASAPNMHFGHVASMSHCWQSSNATYWQHGNLCLRQIGNIR